MILPPFAMSSIMPSQSFSKVWQVESVVLMVVYFSLLAYPTALHKKPAAESLKRTRTTNQLETLSPEGNYCCA
jgi:hypothetical protein